jgi:hypothetical protein
MNPWAMIFCAFVTTSVGAARVGAATVPFTEDFTATVAKWADNSGLSLLTHIATGGPDGGAYAATSKSLMNLADQSVVLFRAQDEFNSSEHAFEGNWLSEGVGRFSTFVRHNAPVPLNYFTRFSSPAAFPGGVAVKFIPVLPNTWTALTFSISPANPEFVTFEGSSFGAVFSNVGHVQVGVEVPGSLGANPTEFTFGIDKPTIAAAVPEPSGFAAAVFLGIAFFVTQRRPIF